MAGNANSGRGSGGARPGSGRKLGSHLSEHVRMKIEADKIVKRLQDHALSEEGDLMTVSQVNAACKLLNKILPDLQAVQMSGEEGGPITIRVTLGGDT